MQKKYLLLILFSYISCNEQIETEKNSIDNTEIIEETATSVVEDIPETMTVPVQAEVINDEHQLSESKKREKDESMDNLYKISVDVKNDYASKNEGKTFSIDEGGCYVCGKYVPSYDRKNAEYKTQVGYEYRTVWLCPQHYEAHKKRGINY